MITGTAGLFQRRYIYRFVYYCYVSHTETQDFHTIGYWKDSSRTNYEDSSYSIYKFNKLFPIYTSAKKYYDKEKRKPIALSPSGWSFDRKANKKFKSAFSP